MSTQEDYYKWLTQDIINLHEKFGNDRTAKSKGFFKLSLKYSLKHPLLFNRTMKRLEKEGYLKGIPKEVIMNE